MSFTYDDTGIRTSKTVNGVTHTYQLNGSQIISEQWDDKLLVYLYDASGSPIGMMYRTTSYELDEWNVFWYEKNLQGDVVAVYNSMGQELVNYSYDAWGNQTVKYWNGGGTTPAQYNPFRYRGYYYDTDLGMYYLQSRYYDAKICRFINADSYFSTGQGILGNNMFAYCNNNPVNSVDPTGEISITAVLYSCLLVSAMLLLFSIPNSDSTTKSSTITPIQGITPGVEGLGNGTSKNDDFAGYTVYGLMNPETDIIEYVGRTKNVSARKAAHSNSINRGHLEFVSLKDNLTYIEARMWEQYYMMSYHTLNPNNPVNNQINGIRINNPNMEIYRNALLRYIDNKISNEILNWFGV